MRFLTLAEALVIAEAVTGISAHTLQSAARIELLDSALHAPQAGFGDEDFHPTPEEKAAVLCVRLARNHPLPRLVEDETTLPVDVTALAVRIGCEGRAVQTRQSLLMVLRHRRAG